MATHQASPPARERTALKPRARRSRWSSPTPPLHRGGVLTQFLAKMPTPGSGAEACDMVCHCSAQIQQVGTPQAPFSNGPEEPVLTEATGAALQRISNFSFWCAAP